MRHASLTTPAEVSPPLACFALMDKRGAEVRAERRARPHKPWVSLAARRTTLGKLGNFWTQELDDLSFRGRWKVLKRLELACQLEARRSEPTHYLHYQYNFNRHGSTLAAYNAERLAVDALIMPVARAA